ncbi:MAG: D-Ala-D-Ala carboxypeptidase family metallohydrolase [Hyphomicrobiaceae bacterium]
MRKVLFAVLVTACAALAPLAAHAKRYHGDTNDRGRQSQRHSPSRTGGEASRSCLTSEARSVLNKIEAKFGRVEIVSTCRPGARIATSGRPSKHASGRAIDFRVRGQKSQVIQWLRNNHGGGTMTYSDMDHIHVDVGHRFVALNRDSGH